jgi:hypothetical protein
MADNFRSMYLHEMKTRLNKENISDAEVEEEYWGLSTYCRLHSYRCWQAGDQAP